MAEKDYQKIYEQGVALLKVKILEFHEKWKDGMGGIQVIDETATIDGMLQALGIFSMQERFDILQEATKSDFYNSLPPLGKLMAFGVILNKTRRQ